MPGCTRGPFTGPGRVFMNHSESGPSLAAMLNRLWGTLGSQPRAAKVPEVIALFWVMKVLTTGIGESSSDFLAKQSIPLAALIGTGGIALALWLQLRAREYQAWPYWFAVLMVAVFGTMVADGLHKGAGIPYAVSTVMCAIGVAVIFFLWHRVEGTLDIHSITTKRREIFYWLAVLATFALGTAAGDLTAFTLNLGFSGSIALFAVAIAIPLVAWRRFGMNPVLAFWSAYVITRPLGASIADWLGKSRSLSGLGLGDGLVSLLGLIVFAGFVAYTARTKPDIQREHALVGATHPRHRRVGEVAPDTVG
jgi:uncharacterized membrane-anchored protein